MNAALLSKLPVKAQHARAQPPRVRFAFRVVGRRVVVDFDVRRFVGERLDDVRIAVVDADADGLVRVIAFPQPGWFFRAFDDVVPNTTTVIVHGSPTVFTDCAIPTAPPGSVARLLTTTKLG